MRAKKLEPRDLLLAAAVIFGRGKDPSEIYFRICAYEKLLELTEEYGDDIEEFDVIRTLEEIPGFRTRDEMRRIANELGILQRHGSGLVSVKREIFLDDVFPGDQPSRLASVPSDFVRQLYQADTGQLAEAADLEDVFRLALAGLPKILDAAERSPLGFVTPFYRPNGTGDAVKLSFTGAAAATTPFLDLYLAAGDVESFAGGEASATRDEVYRRAAGFIKAYLDKLARDDALGDDGALLLEDDDDYPGATRPVSLSNAQLISALVADARWRQGGEGNGGSLDVGVIEQLATFLLGCQNDDGGWSCYRYDAESVGQRGTQNESIPLFSFVVLAGLLDATEVLDATWKERIQGAASRCMNWIVNTAVMVSDVEAAWVDGEGRVSVYETAINIMACLLLPAMLPDAKAQLDRLVSNAVRFIDSAWRVGPDARANDHRIQFRPPRDDGPALLPLVWVNPGHARVLRALSLVALKRGIFPGFRSAAEMEKAVALICRDCRDGFWMHITNPEVLSVSTTAQYLQALAAYRAAIRGWRSA